MSTPANLPVDTRGLQIERLADAMEANPGSTHLQLDAIAHTGSATKCISDMGKQGFGIRRKRGWAMEDGIRRPRMHYWLDSRPEPSQPELFPTE